jgi:hypothetical protein
MYDAAELRKRARHCIEQAEEPDMQPSRQLALLRFAATLLELADEAERINRLIGDAMTGTKPHLDS